MYIGRVADFCNFALLVGDFAFSQFSMGSCIPEDPLPTLFFVFHHSDHVLTYTFPKRRSLLGANTILFVTMKVLSSPWRLFAAVVFLSAMESTWGFLIAPGHSPTTTMLCATTAVEVCGFKDCRARGGGARLQKLISTVSSS